MKEKELTKIERTLIEELYNNKELIYKFSDKYDVLFIQCNNDIEKQNLFSIFKKMNIDIKETRGDNHYTMSLVDIWFSKSEISVSYELWHILQSNIVRKNNSITYDKFISILSNNKDLKKYIDSIEDECERINLSIKDDTFIVVKYDKNNEDKLFKYLEDVCFREYMISDYEPALSTNEICVFLNGDCYFKNQKGFYINNMFGNYVITVDEFITINNIYMKHKDEFISTIFDVVSKHSK